MSDSNISIVWPLYNAHSYLNQIISICGKIQKLDGDGLELCIIDSSSTDGTQEALVKNNISGIYTVETSDFDHGGTRTLAKDLCNGDIIVYLTQDSLPLTYVDIKRLVSVFEDESVGAAYGRQLPYKDTNLFGKHLREFNYGCDSYIRSLEDKELFGIKTTSLSNSFSAYRRSAMDNIGWFKNELILGEDVYAGAKLLQSGYKLAYVADAQVYHSHSYTVFEEFKRYFDIGVFHQMESWILDEFGKPEGEGMRYIRSEFKYLLHHKAYHLVPEFFVRNIMKFLGYKIGKNYLILPKYLIKKFSMHHRWWDKRWAQEQCQS